MKHDTRILGIFELQLGELLGGFRSPRLQRPKRGFISCCPLGIVMPRIYRFEHIGCTLSPFDHERSDRSELMTPRLADNRSRNADPGADRLVQSLEARTGVQRVALRAVFEPRTGADVAHHRDAGMYANPGVPEIDTAGFLFRAETGSELDDSQGGADGAVGMIGLLVRRAKKRQHSIAGKFVDQPPLLENCGADALEIIVRQVGEKLWIHRLGESRKTGNVAEQYRNFAPFAAQFR